MRRILLKGLLAVSIVLSVVVSAAHAVPPSGKGSQPASASQAQAGQDNAAKKCKAERASMGEQAFAERYGTNPNKRNAFGKCVSKYSKDKAAKPGDDEDDEGDDQKQDNAAKKCKAERASMGEKAFAERYGTNPNKRNAFGKCVAKYSKDKPKPAKP